MTHAFCHKFAHMINNPQDHPHGDAPPCAQDSHNLDNWEPTNPQIYKINYFILYDLKVETWTEQEGLGMCFNKFFLILWVFDFLCFYSINGSLKE